MFPKVAVQDDDRRTTGQLRYNMKFAGIITEYDPFHNGHATQLQMLRQRGAETIAVCMSSGAVQRGGVPLFPESVRVRAALLGGADLVVALPAPYANTGAEAFAAAGVALLTALGCDTLAFGAEDPDADRLLQAARLLEAPDLSAQLRGYLGQGMTFAAARAKAAEELQPGLSDLLSRPNNILGIEYCKALLAQHSPMQPLALHRLGADHGSVQPGRAGQTLLASASFLRAAVRRGGVEALAPYVPEPAMEVYRHAAAQGLTMDAGRFSLALLTLLRVGGPGPFCPGAWCQRRAGTPPFRCRAAGLGRRGPVCSPQDKTVPPCPTAPPGPGCGHGGGSRIHAGAAALPACTGGPASGTALAAERGDARFHLSVQAGTGPAPSRKSYQDAQFLYEFFGTMQGTNPAHGPCVYRKTSGIID